MTSCATCQIKLLVFKIPDTRANMLLPCQCHGCADFPPHWEPRGGLCVGVGRSVCQQWGHGEGMGSYKKGATAGTNVNNGEKERQVCINE